MTTTSNAVNCWPGREEMAQEQAAQIVTMQDTTANPAPLGLLGFGLTTVLLNMHNAGFYPLDSMILAMGIFYGGMAQIFAGIFEWKKKNTFGTTAFLSYGLFWLTLVALVVIPKFGWVPAQSSKSFAAYLFMWGLFTFIMFFGTLRANRALQFVFLVHPENAWVGGDGCVSELRGPHPGPLPEGEGVRLRQRGAARFPLPPGEGQGEGCTGKRAVAGGFPRAG